jgi:hypothetical protein
MLRKVGKASPLAKVSRVRFTRLLDGCASRQLCQFSSLNKSILSDTSLGIIVLILLQPFYGHSVCEAKINPAPKSIAKKLVTKVSPLAAKDTIIAPRVSAPALMCFGSIINLALPHQYGGKRYAEYERDPYSIICMRFLWKVPLHCWTCLCKNGCSDALR